MSITRQKAIESAVMYRASDEPQRGRGGVQKFFGQNVFSEEQMKTHLSSATYDALRQTIAAGQPLDSAIADQVAAAMSSWAIERGATHYAHVFYPLTGLTAEKHDSFFSPDGVGHLIIDFSGRQLVQGEPDASSLPTGGIRASFEARGYTAWDVTSPAYLMEGRNGITLCIPTAFYSWTGEALDKKVPLLRSMQAVTRQAERLLRLFGHKEPRVVVSAGPEQEYFLIDRNFYYARPDLLSAGRTLFGTRPPKGQELADQYFGTIPQRVLAFMVEVDAELYELGVPVKTRHNEVAPGQYEIAPVFESANLATDHQYLVMQVLQSVAPKYGLACLLHPKPFAGINGSGKHINWSLDLPGGGSLFNPGRTPHDNMQFLVFFSAVVRAVSRHSVMLSGAVADAANDQRLGAHEAPPATISIFIGEQLERIFERIAAGGSAEAEELGTLEVGVDTLPPLPKDATDRNRTSPLAFNGNRFEFRAAGSNQSIAGAQVVINAMVAEALDEIATELEAPEVAQGGFKEAVQRLLQRIWREHGAIVFNGDNYAAQWQEEATRRGLPRAANTPEAIDAMECEATYALFERYKVLSRREAASRFEIYREKYCKDVMIEARLCLSMVRTMIFPAGVRYQHLLSETAVNLTTLKQAHCTTTLEKVTALLASLQQLAFELEAALDVPEDLNTAARSHYMAERILPRMAALRAKADALEHICDDGLWPLPTYQEMLFIR